MYPFMTLDDHTEIVHSKLMDDGRVKLYIEKPDAIDCFHHATCYLPDFIWKDIFGFNADEISEYDALIRRMEKQIMLCAKQRRHDGKSC